MGPQTDMVWKGCDGTTYHVKDLWDGKKLRIYQDLWNLSEEWKLSIVFDNPTCKVGYQPFHGKHVLLINNWDEVAQQYIFYYKICNQYIT